jgi:hypothetical protein
VFFLIDPLKNFLRGPHLLKVRSSCEKITQLLYKYMISYFLGRKIEAKLTSQLARQLLNNNTPLCDVASIYFSRRQM